MRKTHHKSVHHPGAARAGLGFFENSTDGQLRLAACAFIAVGLSFFLWQIGMLPGLH